jgi:hypothetical protein
MSARYLETQARPSAIGLHAPLQQSVSAEQDAPSALQATSCRPGPDWPAQPCLVKKDVTTRCEVRSARSSSHATAGKATILTKSAKTIGETTRTRMMTSLRPGFS